MTVKICQGFDSTQPDTETTTVYHVKDSRQGSENFLDPYDMFVVRGLSGYHVYLMNIVVISLAGLGASGGRLEKLYHPRSVISQLVSGLLFQSISHRGRPLAVTRGQ